MVDLTERERGFVEGYACALDLLRHCVTGDSGSAKSYDPATIEGDTIHSYAFDLKRGFRHHPLSDYSSGLEICELMLKETLAAMKEDGARLATDEIDSEWVARNYPEGRAEWWPLDDDRALVFFGSHDRIKWEWLCPAVRGPNNSFRAEAAFVPRHRIIKVDYDNATEKVWLRQ